MDLNKISMSELVSLDQKKLVEISSDIRKEISKNRIDPYLDRGTLNSRVRGLKKSLARALTAKNLKK